MEALTSFLEILNTLTPLAVISLLGVVIFLLVYKNPFKPIQQSITEVKDNHLHELPVISKNIETMLEVLQRMEVKMGEDFSYIKARINGGKF